MSEPTSAGAAAPARDADVYRPLSGLALAGFGLASLFALWLLTTAVIGFRSDTPPLISPAWMIVPALGFGLSLLAWLRINRSEGTLAGLKLAQWGTTLGLATVGFYLAWYFGTEWALGNQANTITAAWFDDLQQQEGTDPTASVAAFMTSLPPAFRDQDTDLTNAVIRDDLRKNPEKLKTVTKSLRLRHFWGDNQQKGLWPVFFDHEIVRLVSRQSSEPKIEFQGIRSWEHLSGSQGGYKVEQIFRITTREGVYEVIIPALRQEGKEGGQRQWQWQVLLYEATVVRRDLNSRGKAIGRLRMESRRFATEWATKLARGQAEEAFLDTVAAADRARLRAEWRQRLLVFALAGTSETELVLGASPVLADPEGARRLFLPGYAGFAAGNLVLTKPDQIMAPRKLRDEMHKEIVEVFARTGRGPTQALQVADEGTQPTSSWASVPDELRFAQPFIMSLSSGQRVEGNVIVASRDPAVLRQLDETGTPDDSNAAARRGTSKPWRIVGIELTAGAETRQGPGGSRKEAR